jgi:hypothetical protein
VFVILTYTHHIVIPTAFPSHVAPLSVTSCTLSSPSTTVGTIKGGLGGAWVVDRMVESLQRILPVRPSSHERLTTPSVGLINTALQGVRESENWCSTQRVVRYLLMWASTRLATQHEMTSIQIKIGDAPNHRSRMI